MENSKRKISFQLFSFSFVIFLSVLCVFVVQLNAQNLDDLAGEIKFGSIEIKREALYQIRNLQTAEASQIAVPALQDSNEIVRATATHSVIYLPSDESFRVLIPLLNDKFPFVRKETAYALGKTKNSNAVQPLLLLLQRDKDLEVRMASALALGEIGEVSAVDSLLKILQKKPKESEDFLRRAAARSIGQIAQIQQVRNGYIVTPESFLPDKYDTFVNFKYSNLTEVQPIFREAVNLLIKVLLNQKESNDVRREAAFALGSIADETAIKTLQANLNSPDYYLAEICKESLTKISRVGKVD